jgi:spore cortex formation protein SpoVR/YcgB (stage V sporulation)
VVPSWGYGHSDLRRICEPPTDEDREWFPDLAGTGWLGTFDSAMRNYQDESFIRQYLPPGPIRQFKLFNVVDDEREEMLEVNAIHDEQGYRSVRRALAQQYDRSSIAPNIPVAQVDARADYPMALRHCEHNGVGLHDDAKSAYATLRVHRFTVRLEGAGRRRVSIKDARVRYMMAFVCRVVNSILIHNRVTFHVARCGSVTWSTEREFWLTLARKTAELSTNRTSSTDDAYTHGPEG